MGHRDRIAMLAFALTLTGSCKSPPDEPKTQEPPGAEPAAPAQLSDAATRAGDPMFPTQTTAGTKQIFFLEEPDRGRHITEAALPPAKQLTWSRHAYCELEATGMVCSAAAASAGAEHWRIGRTTGVTLAERWHGGVRAGRILLARNDAGALTEVVVFRDDGTVDWARSYEQPGVRYSERARTGANQLEGCGFIKVTLDTKGRATAVTCLQWLLSPMTDARGVATTKTKREPSGFVVEEQRLDPAGAPVNGHDGVSRIEIDRDSAGRVIARRFFDRGGKAVSSGNGGCAGETSRYDGRGRMIEWRCLDPSGNPASTRPDPVKRFRYDDRGCEIRETRLTGTLAPASIDGVHARTQ